MSIKANSAYNLLGSVIPLVVGAVTIPYLIKNIGVERFGILTLLWVLIGYFSLFDFGMGRALTQRISLCRINDESELMPQVVGSGLRFLVIAGGVGFSILLVCSWPLASSWLNVSEALKYEVKASLIVAAFGIPIATLSTGFRGILEGIEEFYSANLVKSIMGMALFIFPIIGVLLGSKSLVLISISLVIARMLGLVLYWWLIRIKLSSHIINFKHNAEAAKGMFSFGGWMAISNLISPVLVNLDRFLISYTLGASVVAFYTVPFEFIVRFLILPAAIGAALLPRLTMLFKMKDPSARTLFYKAEIVTFVAISMVAVGVYFLGHPIMEYFITDEFADKAWPISVILSIGVIFNGIAYIPYTALHSLGYAKPTAILHVSELFIYCGVLWLLIGNYGLVGAAVAWLLRVVVDCLVLHVIFFIKASKSTIDV